MKNSHETISFALSTEESDSNLCRDYHQGVLGVGSSCLVMFFTIIGTAFFMSLGTLNDASKSAYQGLCPFL